MIWTSLLLNASCFGVYLLLFYLKFGVHPSFGATVAALLLLGLLPSVVGFYTNRNALTRNPTVAGLVGVNLLWLALYC
ncbi:MAG TPA: hypothetical protein VFD15_02495, partial [Clostridia bacterium]|nr:hypothetical protein [Clostridia bacterium]